MAIAFAGSYGVLAETSRLSNVNNLVPAVQLCCAIEIEVATDSILIGDALNETDAQGLAHHLTLSRRGMWVGTYALWR